MVGTQTGATATLLMPPSAPACSPVSLLLPEALLWQRGTAVAGSGGLPVLDASGHRTHTTALSWERKLPEESSATHHWH